MEEHSLRYCLMKLLSNIPDIKSSYKSTCKSLCIIKEIHDKFLKTFQNIPNIEKQAKDLNDEINEIMNSFCDHSKNCGFLNTDPAKLFYLDFSYESECDKNHKVVLESDFKYTFNIDTSFVHKHSQSIKNFAGNITKFLPLERNCNVCHSTTKLKLISKNNPKSMMFSLEYCKTPSILEVFYILSTFPMSFANDFFYILCDLEIESIEYKLSGFIFYSVFFLIFLSNFRFFCNCS